MLQVSCIIANITFKNAALKYSETSNPTSFHGTTCQVVLAFESGLYSVKAIAVTLPIR